MADYLTQPSKTKDASNAPVHIAIIMDGNGRWAKKRLLPRTAGHYAGVKTVRKMVEACIDRGIKALTLFAFSSENWRRPPDEVSILLKLFLNTLDKEIRTMHEEGIRLRIIGDTTVFPDALRQKIEQTESLTRDNKRFDLVVAANYGGRWDIVQAARKLAERVAKGELQAADINDELLEDNLCFSDIPEPDLFIRTGGESRISNFMLWHLAYTEMYFTPTLWPDFDESALDMAILDYSKRQRRFGRTGDQVARMQSNKPTS
jgi:undecaprenyl diphosphate synthase